LTAAAGLRVWLTAADAARAARYHQAVDRDRAVASSGLLRLAAAELAGVDPAELTVVRRCRTCGGGGDHGRPVAVTPDGETMPGVHLSSAHAGGLVLVAASREAPVGIDLEPLDGAGPDSWTIERIALTPGERASLEGLAGADLDRARLRLWVRKEAVLKATGHGLAVAPHLVDVAGPVGRWRADPAAPVGHQGADLAEVLAEGASLVDVDLEREPKLGYVAALAVLGVSAEVGPAEVTIEWHCDPLG
jgi:4'-phosphopantetheinyl transferase